MITGSVNVASVLSTVFGRRFSTMEHRLAISSVCVPLLALYAIGKPVVSGFWCNDQSLSYPYKPDTISSSLLLVISFGGPFLVMAVTESIRAAVKSRPPRKFRTEILSLGKAYGIFLFGFTAVCIFTNTLKIAVGRLRPHFFDLCKPDFDKINCTTDEGVDSLMAFRSNRFSSAPARPRFDLWKHLSIISLLKFIAVFLFLLMLKLVEIALRDLLAEKSLFRKLLFPKRGFIFLPKAKPIPTYVTFDKTTTLLDTWDMCVDVNEYDALMIVHTADTHFTHRQNYRQSYGSPEFTHPYKMKIVFFLGLPCNASLQPLILQENTLHGDTVQGNFTDTYRNLTYKGVMAYRWVSENCKGAKLVLKMDDDVILDVHRFFEEFWYPPLYQQELIFCHVWKLGEVERKGKWGISYQDYKPDFYPPYCSGFFVVVMPAIVEDLYHVARATPFLWLDDVFIYGVVREAMQDVQIINLDEVAYREEHYFACYRQYGYRCKYWVSVQGEQREFIPSLLALRADRLRALARAETASHRQGRTQEKNPNNIISNTDIINNIISNSSSGSSNHPNPPPHYLPPTDSVGNVREMNGGNTESDQQN